MILGIAGLIIITLAYLLNLFNVLNRKHFVYLWMNIIGAVILTYYAFQIDDLPFIILNIVWALFTLIDFIKIKFSQ